MVQLENNEIEAIIKALDEGTAKERRYAANLLEKKKYESDQQSRILLNENQIKALKEQHIKEHLSEQANP